MSQRSGHSGGENVGGGKVLRSSPLFLVQGGLKIGGGPEGGSCLY